jgi:hypothetical protein
MSSQNGGFVSQKRIGASLCLPDSGAAVSPVPSSVTIATFPVRPFPDKRTRITFSAIHSQLLWGTTVTPKNSSSQFGFVSQKHMFFTIEVALPGRTFSKGEFNSRFMVPNIPTLPSGVQQNNRLTIFKACPPPRRG